MKEKQYQERKNQIKALEAEIDDLLFLTPHSLQEIIQEGSILRHCVGSQHYIERHTQEKQRCFYPKKRKARYALLHIRISKSTGYTNTRKCNRQEVPEKIKQAVRQWQENLQHALSS
ncbi:PcfJ domain-containing protein [Enterococcus faecalis]|uniref:PcfJ domain-containing protein n=1 Tax=Enterococcus faecalis TaxID=1351 RepID=UPI0021613FB9|nr:PcfJ domain-containing protein [Enterococcus faecalis]